MSAKDDDTLWWVALVTFERDKTETEFLPSECQAAVGWMCCFWPDKETVGDQFEIALRAVGLRLIELQDLQPVDSVDEIENIDSHLAANIAALEPGKCVVWGTIHTYLASGEA